MIINSDDYHRMRTAAHQKPSSLCSHRAIVRHCSFWVEDINPNCKLNPQDNRIEQELSEFKTRKTDIDDEFSAETELLDELFFSLKYYGDSIFYSTSDFRGESDYGDYIIYADYDRFGLYNRIIISRHYNRVSLKHIVDMEYSSSELGDRAVNNNELSNRFDSARDIIDRYQAILEGIADNDLIEQKRDYVHEEFWSHPENGLIFEVVKYLFEDYWNEVDGRLVRLNPRAELFRLFREPKRGKYVPRRFADFRGIVWPARASLPEQREGDLKEEILAPDHRLLRLNWPMVKASEYSYRATRKHFSRNDIIACGIGQSTEAHNNVGIYVSSLGQKPYIVSNSDIDQYYPVKYFIFTKNRNYRQIGRTVDKIDRLGTYRLMALRDYHKLRDAGKEIQKIGEIIDKADEVAFEKERFAVFVKEIGQAIESIGANIEGGLAYRITVSERYSFALHQLIDTMSFQKIAGFETYEEFVRRKLFRIYAYNASLGERLVKIRSRQSMLMAQLQFNAIEQRQEEANQLTETGHLIEIAAITYYVGGMIKYAFDGEAIGALPYMFAFGFWIIIREKLREDLYRNIRDAVLSGWNRISIIYRRIARNF